MTAEFCKRCGKPLPYSGAVCGWDCSARPVDAREEEQTVRALIERLRDADARERDGGNRLCAEAARVLELQLAELVGWRQSAERDSHITVKLDELAASQVELLVTLERVAKLESAEAERQNEAEAATHADGCKCGNYGHY